MSKASPRSEHGTTRSYVVGFVLSLVFTIIPYHLVVNKVLTDDALLVTIVGIAILQMFIQIFFFLHLGRGPKPFYNVVFFFATAGLIVLVIGASLFIMNNLYHNMSPEEAVRKLAQKEGISQIGGEETGACQGNKDNHIITINGSKANPMHIEAQRCDTLTFMNEDELKHEIAFGTHPEDASYGGEDEVVLDDGRPETITLNESGDFVFHDHMDPNLTGHFSVAP
jgi:cytochrome o ubiquinol oxidase subunit IV